MQADLPDHSLVRETIAALGPGGKDFTLDDVAAWIRQLEGLCDSKDVALAPASFRTDIRGSCLSKFPASGTSAQRTELQTKAVKGYSPIPELRMEKVSSKKKNAHGEAKLRLIIERGRVLVLLTITDLHDATRTLLAVTEGNNDLIPIKHPAATIEATVIPFAPDQLLRRLRRIEAKNKPLREQLVPSSASPQQSVEEASAQPQAEGVEYMRTRSGSDVIEKIVDRETGTVTWKSSGCPKHVSLRHCEDVNCTEAPTTVSLIIKNGEMEVVDDDPRMNGVLAPILKSFRENHNLVSELHKRKEALLKEERAIREKLPTAKPAEKKRLLKELENKKAEFEKLTGTLYRTAAGGWMRVPKEELVALVEKAKQKDPESYEALRWRASAALDEYEEIKEKLESTSGQTKKKRLSALLGRKEIEFDAVMNDIALVAGGSQQGGSKERNDVSARMNEALVLDESP